MTLLRLRSGAGAYWIVFSMCMLFLAACTGTDSNSEQSETECETQFDCESGYRCINNRCVSSSCISNADCLAGEECQFDSRTNQGICSSQDLTGDGDQSTDAPSDGDDQPADICVAGEHRCVGNDLQLCGRHNGRLDWRFEMECELGCEDSACITEDGDEDVPEIPVDGDIDSDPEIEVICEADALRCYSNNVEQCAADGSAWTIIDDCINGTCVETPIATCGPKIICQPGMRICDLSGANAVANCNEDGTDWDIYQCWNQECIDGICVDNNECNRGRYRCNGNTVEVCNNAGTAWTVVMQCRENETCACGQFVGSDCALADCTSNSICAAFTETRCSGNVVQRCSFDGTTWQFWEDCAENSQVCQNGQCI